MRRLYYVCMIDTARSDRVRCGLHGLTSHTRTRAPKMDFKQHASPPMRSAADCCRFESTVNFRCKAPPQPGWNLKPSARPHSLRLQWAGAENHRSHIAPGLRTALLCLWCPRKIFKLNQNSNQTPARLRLIHAVRPPGLPLD